MDRKTTGRRVGNRNRTTARTSGATSRRTRRRLGLASRRNRRQGIRRNRNRLARALNNIGPNRRGPQRRLRRFNNFNRRRNLRFRIVFVGGLPTDVDNRRLYSLFKKEGRKPIIAKMNGEICELNVVPSDGDEIEFYDLTNSIANRVYVNGLILLLNYAFNELYHGKNVITVKHSVDKSL